MGNFGERLQREREMRSITLQEISNSTKISSRMLKALEDEDFAKLPGGIFNKGFVRAYCRFLGIDEEQAVADYMAALAENEKKTPESAKSAGPISDNLQPSLFGPQFDRQNLIPFVEPQGSSFDLSQHLVTATVVLVLFLGGAGLAKYFYDHSDVVSAKNSGQAQVAVEREPVVTPVPKSSVDATSSTTQPISNATEKTSPTLTESASLNPDTGSAKVNTTSTVFTSDKISTGPSQNVATDPTNGSVTGFIHVQIHAREDSWARITGDGKLLMEGVIKANMDRSFRTGKEMVVVLGNAGGVEMSFNGRQLPSFAPALKYKQLSFDPTGLINQ